LKGYDWKGIYMADTDQISRMKIKDFVYDGYLQEVNRQFLHPLGLALEAVTDSNGEIVGLGGVWDYRKDDEGILFADEVVHSERFRRRASNILWLQRLRQKDRERMLGHNVQPVPGIENQNEKP
jgi:hypothetical protein